MKDKYEHTQVLSKVGANITRLRKEREMSQTTLAYLANVDRSHLNQIENGNNNASVIFLAKLADSLGVPMTCFFEGLEKHPPCELFLPKGARSRRRASKKASKQTGEKPAKRSKKASEGAKKTSSRKRRQKEQPPQA